MKVFASFMAASIVCASIMGCTRPHGEDEHAPMITVTANHRSIRTGETTEVRAMTVNLVGASGINWTVSPSTASVTPDRNNGMVAIFAANEPGTYVIRARAQQPDGSWVNSNSENVTVSGPPRNDRGGLDTRGPVNRGAPAPVDRAPLDRGAPGPGR